MLFRSHIQRYPYGRFAGGERVRTSVNDEEVQGQNDDETYGGGQLQPNRHIHALAAIFLVEPQDILVLRFPHGFELTTQIVDFISVACGYLELQGGSCLFHTGR